MAIVEFRGGDLSNHLRRKRKEKLVDAYIRLLRAYEQATPGRRIMEAELAVDVYDGETCDQHRPYWKGWGEGDKDAASEIGDTIELSIAKFRPGTQVFIYEPVCPQCEQARELCEGDQDCDYDWRERDEIHYG